MPATCQQDSLAELGLGMVVAALMQTLRHDPARYNSKMTVRRCMRAFMLSQLEPGDVSWFAVGSQQALIILLLPIRTCL